MKNDQSYAKVIADSVSPEGVRLTTMEVRFHRFVLAEFNTHRVFSRNSASSRARPVSKILREVEETPATPISFPAEQKGMQGGAELDARTVQQAEETWVQASIGARYAARDLVNLGVHKSVANRVLEPFLGHTVVVTSTSWANFFEQRVSPLAQPEVRVAAEKMLAAHEESEPVALEGGQWHLPYIEDEDWAAMDRYLHTSAGDATIERTLAQVSAARCARVSYLTQDGKRDLSADIALYDRLVSASPWHGSPLEHVATPWAANRTEVVIDFEDLHGRWQTARRTIPLFGNLIGWRQLRLEIEAAQGFTPLV